MKIIGIILQTEVIAGILIIGAFLIMIISLLRFSKEKARLHPQLEKIEKELKHIRSRFERKKAGVVELQKEVSRLKEQEEPMRLYADKIREMDVGEERKNREGQLMTEIATRERKKKIKPKKKKVIPPKDA